jgi:hypothetical protein
MISSGKFICPLTKQIMWDPVTASDGHNYEKYAIIERFRQGNYLSPITEKLMEESVLIPNHHLRESIEKYIRHWLKYCSEPHIDEGYLGQT